MTKRLLPSLVFLIVPFLTIGQCTVDYSYAANLIAVEFTNTSSVDHAHYYWHFGDGSGSNEASPTHAYPASGTYIVTLYALDSLSGCHGHRQMTLALEEPADETCDPYMTDTIIAGEDHDVLWITPASVGCVGVYGNLDGGPAQNTPFGNSIYLGPSWTSALWLTRVQYFVSDSISGSYLRGEYYRTRPYHFSPTPSYDTCSANFEMITTYGEEGATVLLTAMDDSAVSYDFIVTGFGNPIHHTSRTAAQYYPYTSYEKFRPHSIGLNTNSAGGCGDTLWQTVLVENPHYVIPPSCYIIEQPDLVVTAEGTTARFHVLTESEEVNYQWQQDSGTGFMDLTDAGPFSGANNDTLYVANVQDWMNNYHYRCLVTGDEGGCHNTSSVAVLNIGEVGIGEYSATYFPVMPNPVVDILHLPEGGAYRVRLYDRLGAVVLLGDRVMTIDMSGQAAGLYHLEVLDLEGVPVKRSKVIKL